MRRAMAEASRVVLAGFELATDVKVACWPDRYADARGRKMWNRVCSLVMAVEEASQPLSIPA
jgi:DNA polymerase-1